jgi:hypothetical protein
VLGSIQFILFILWVVFAFAYWESVQGEVWRARRKAKEAAR